MRRGPLVVLVALALGVLLQACHDAPPAGSPAPAAKPRERAIALTVRGLG